MYSLSMRPMKSKVKSIVIHFDRKELSKLGFDSTDAKKCQEMLQQANTEIKTLNFRLSRIVSSGNVHQ